MKICARLGWQAESTPEAAVGFGSRSAPLCFVESADLEDVCSRTDELSQAVINGNEELKYRFESKISTRDAVLVSRSIIDHNRRITRAISWLCVFRTQELGENWWIDNHGLRCVYKKQLFFFPFIPHLHSRNYKNTIMCSQPPFIQPFFPNPVPIPMNASNANALIKKREFTRGRRRVRRPSRDYRPSWRRRRW